MSSSEVRNEVFLSLTFTGVKLHLRLPPIPLASPCSETIKYPNDPDGEPLQESTLFSAVEIYFILSTKLESPKVERVIFKSSPRAEWKKIDQMT